MHNIYPNALHTDSGEKAPKGNTEIESAEVVPTDDISCEKPILLVVEDNSDICEYISESFSDSFDVVTASEGEAGCRAAIAHIPDIIVTDIMMAGMNGITFCKT